MTLSTEILPSKVSLSIFSLAKFFQFVNVNFRVFYEHFPKVAFLTVFLLDIHKKSGHN